ncbi:MAG: conjugative transfer signal peptidase TraF [Gammaproteobacteria bacterium]|nr:conjugative transfer signal peptidase TraF [Gammaproteobacteria bacterium]
MKAKIIITILFFIVLDYISQSYIINVSPSEPLGIYKIKRNVQFQRGDIVAVCLPSKIQQIGLKRAYLLPGIRCGETAPLIKTIIAMPGDIVILKDDEIIVNDKILPYGTKNFDSEGRKLAKFSRGIYKNINKYWLIGVSSPDSWDSRYWGMVDKKYLLYKVQYWRGFSLDK